MESFRLVRSPENIKLEFSVNADGDRVRLTLVGEKMDFYRMAMGVELPDTLEKLIAGDKSLSVGETDATRQDVFLTINRALPEPPPPPPPPSAPNRDEEINRQYAAALASSDPAKLQAFAAAFPESPKASMAKKLAERFLSEAEYVKLGSDPDAPALRAFLEKYPNSKFAPDAVKKLAVFEKAERARAEEEEKRKVAEEKRRTDEEAARARKLAEEKAEKERQLALEKAERERKQAAEQAERERYAEEKRKTDQLKAERDAFARSRGSIEALKAFLTSFPEGQSSTEAKAQLDRLLEAKEVEEKALAARPRLIAAFTSKAPVVDGDPGDPVWNTTTPVSIELEPQSKKAVKNTLEARALVNGGRIYVRLRWRDPSTDTTYRPWKLDAKSGKYAQSEALDDAMALAIYADTSPEDSCMLHAEPTKTDVWLWRAFWSSISGKASDQMMITSPEKLPKSNPYMSKSGKGQVWVQNLPDKGNPGWMYEPPALKGGGTATIPSYKAVAANGSASDVDASGKHQAGSWTVEFSRVLDTGNDDDVTLPRTGRILASFAAFDHADRENHSSSPLVWIEVQGR